MSAQIVQLSGVRRSGIISSSGICFPQVYRLTGTYFDLKEGAEMVGGLIKNDEDLIPGNEPARASYTLDAQWLPQRIANPKLTPIAHLTPDVDDGWLIVRHHQSAAELEGYMDALYDLCDDPTDNRSRGSFHTEFGHFSLTYRQPTPDTQSCLLIYQTKISCDTGLMDETIVIDADGQKQDSDILFPDDYLEQTSGVMELLNS